MPPKRRTRRKCGKDMSETVYMPTEDGRTQPAPYVLTDEEVVRMIRLECKDTEQALKRYRQSGLLKPTQVGNRLRYLLPDVLRFLADAQEANPR
jgi:hypothetical protein